MVKIILKNYENEPNCNFQRNFKLLLHRCYERQIFSEQTVDRRLGHNKA